MKKAGFIGIGIMGKPMALNLLNAGVSLAVYDVNESAVNAVTAAGAESVQPKDMGGACDIVFTILPNGDIVEDVLFGEQGLASGLKKGSLVVDMSSVTPVQSKMCAKRLRETVQSVEGSRERLTARLPLWLEEKRRTLKKQSHTLILWVPPHC